MIVSLFDASGVALRPWAEAGYDCVAVDLQSYPRRFVHDRIRYVRSDVLAFDMPRETAFAMAFPPCTHLSIIGAPHWKAKGDGPLTEALSLVAIGWAMMLGTGAPCILENTKGRLPRFWRAPDVFVDPYQFHSLAYDGRDECYSKHTALWLGNGAHAPAASDAPKTWDKGRITRMHGGSFERSVTPGGLARAIYLANRHLVRKP